MPSPVSVTRISAQRALPIEREMHPAGRRRELDCVRQQVPDDLLQAIGIAHHGATVDDLRSEVDPLRVRGWPEGIDGGVEDRFELDRPELDPELAGDDAGDVEDVGDELFLHVGVAFDGLERPLHAGGVEFAHSNAAASSRASR